MNAIFNQQRQGLSTLEKGIVMGVAALATSAVANAVLSSAAEANNPPIGKFVEVDGVRLHYVELGAGEPVVFLHGNGTMLQDFMSSGLLNLCGKSFRAIAFDRPGFGYSGRPNDRTWTPAAQAKLFQKAFAKLGIVKPGVVGHSWGTLVAMRLAVDYPSDISRLVLLSGYYFPTLRADTLLSTPGALPIVGTCIQHTVGPLIGRLFANSSIEHMFKPLPVSPSFSASYSTAMALRPSQLKAVASETAMMPSAVESIVAHYKLVRTPVQIFAGEMDAVVDTSEQSVRLHESLSNSQLHIEKGVGHMVHHAIPEKIAAAIAA